MEDLFAQKDVGSSLPAFTNQLLTDEPVIRGYTRSFLIWIYPPCADGRGGDSGLDRQAAGATADLQPGFTSAAANCPGVAAHEETESV